MNSAQLLWTLVAAQLIAIGLAWTATVPMSRGYRGGIVGLVAFNLALGLGLLLIGFRHELPYFLGHPVSNFLALWALVAIIQAGSQLLKIQQSQVEIWVVMTLAGLAILGFGLSEATANLRAMSLFLAVSWLLFRTGLKVWRLQPEPHLRKPVKSIALVCLTLGALLLMRAAVGAFSQASIEFDATDSATLALPFMVLIGVSVVNLGFAYFTISTVMMGLRLRARSDELTGLLNRKATTEEIARAWTRSVQTRHPFALIALDIDNLRNVNAVHGYTMGDVLLVEIAKALRGVLQPGESLGRAGGGKLIAVLPKATLVEARVIAELMRELVADMEKLFADQRVKVSASLGVALSGLSDTSEEAVLARANTQLEHAKVNGRNRVQADGDPIPTRAIESLVTVKPGLG